MRTQNSAKNVSVVLLNSILINIFRFVSRTIFIKFLGEQYLGVNGILSNVLGILALADLGIGNAISFSLYKPLANKDEEKIKSLMMYYKRAYKIIGFIVLISGLFLCPFLNFFVKDYNEIEGLNVYYLVFLFNMASGYFFSYKRTLIIADQAEYKITPIIMIFNFLVTISQILVIVLFKSYLLYLLVQMVFTFVENIVINLYINRKYTYLKDKNVKKIDNDELKKIKLNVKGLIYHKLGTYFVDSTDNIIISKYLGLSIVGIYSNYFLIINMLNSFITSMLRSLTSSIGNVNATENAQKKYEIFKSLNFLNFVIYSICSVCLFNLLNIFIGNVWLDKTFLFDKNIVIILSIIFYVNGFMYFNDIVKGAAGIFYKDKYVPIIQSAINIVVSIVLAKSIGLLGVFIGTIMSTLFVMCIKPIIIYKYIFESNVINYYIDFLKKALLTIFCALLSNRTISFFKIQSPILYFLISGLSCVAISLFIICIVYCKKPEFNDIIKRVRKMVKGVKK